VSFSRILALARSWKLTTARREYLDVFDLFNFPRIPMAQEGGESGNTEGAMGQAAPDLAAMNAAMIPNFAVPNPEADWLYHTN
jgi:hypothetical protein